MASARVLYVISAGEAATSGGKRTRERTDRVAIHSAPISNSCAQSRRPSIVAIREIRAALQALIGRMTAVPQSVWGGMAATQFKDVVHRWNAESMKLHQALHGIAETIRHNEATLRDAAENHALHIGAAAGNL